MTRKIFALTLALAISVAVAAGYSLARLPSAMLTLANSESHETQDDHKNEEADNHGPEEERHDELGVKREGEHGDSELRLTPSQISVAEIESVQVATEDMAVFLSVTGEVTANQDRVAEVVPLVSGTVREVRALLGMQVKQNEIIAVVDSRELADAKSAWVAARERTQLARSKFERDERLWSKRIVSEQEYLDGRTTLAEARIEQRAAEHKLKALGFTETSLRSLAENPGQSFTRYELRAPIDGTVIAKQVTTGESVDPSRPIYRLADLSSMWVIASIYEKDFARLRAGQHAQISSRAYPNRKFEGRVTWVSDTVDESTRTLKVRIEVDNLKRLLKPGMFITAEVAVDYRDRAMTVPAAAIQRGKGEEVVFIAEAEGRFERREVQTGVRSGNRVEVISGLKSGERVVSSGSFILKSEIEKGGFEAGHGH